MSLSQSKRDRLEVPSAYDPTSEGKLGRPEQLILFLIPTLASFGPLLPVAGPMFAFRVAIVVLLLGGLIRLRKGDESPIHQRLVYALAFVWFVASLLLLLIREASEYSWMELTSVLTGLVLLVAAALVQDPRRALRVVIGGWAVAYYVTSAIAFREMVTGQHLPNYLSDRALGGEGIASTFGNPNDYAFFLVASIPFLLVGISKARSFVAKALYVIALLSMPLIIADTQSRFGIAIACALALVFGLAFLRLRVALGLISVSIAITALFPQQLTAALRQFAATLTTNIDVGAFSSGQALGDASAAIRLNLILNGISFTQDSYLLGLGPGGFLERMEAGKFYYPTGGILSPHFGFIEIVSQYGILVLVVFIALLISWFVVGWKVFIRSRNARSLRVAALALVTLVATLPVTTLMTSSFIHPSITWLFLAVLVLLSRSMRVDRVDVMTEVNSPITTTRRDL